MGGQGSGGSSGWGKGVLGPGGVTVVVGAGGPRRPTPPPPPDSPTGSKTPVYYAAVQCTECAINGEVCLPNGQLGLIPVPPGSDPLGHLPPGDTVPFYVEIVNSITGQVVGYTGQTLCNPAVAPPPPPPPAGVVWRTVPLPVAQIEFNPGTYGVTQLPTWYWLANDANGVDVRVAIPGGVGGYAVTLAVHPVAYYWSFGDGQTGVSYVAGGPGSASSASTTHTYVGPGTFQVGVTVAWAGSYTFTGYGVSETVALGPVDQPESSHSYVVQQIRSILVPPTRN